MLQSSSSSQSKADDSPPDDSHPEETTTTTSLTQSDWFSAVRNHDLNTVKEIIESGTVDINATDQVRSVNIGNTNITVTKFVNFMLKIKW